VAAISSWMTAFFAIACGLVVASVYYSQPIAGPIGASLGLSPSATGLIVTATQAGFGLGLLLIVPLGDLFENRRLILLLVTLTAAALLAAAMSTSPLPFLVSAVVLGLGSVAVQVMVPFAAHLAPEEMRGRVVGNVMSGVMVGILLARPVASFVTEIASWHAIFFGSAAAMGALAVGLIFGLPKRVPVARVTYGALLKSMAYLALTTTVLQRRALYQACLFGAFSLFWTTVPLLLVGPQFHLSEGGVALFTLAGGAGAIAAPAAGRLADRGWTRPATAFAILAVATALLVTRFADDGSGESLAVLVGAAILLDFGMTANLTLGQRAIFVLAPEFRSRLNGLYIAAFFAGGAAGSAVGGWAYAAGGWPLASLIGFALPMAALIFFVTELRQPT
jgi:predicted MFS family arabinose efflux permease